MSSSVPPKMPPGTGRIGTMTPEQQVVLDKFRQELKDEGYFDAERHDDHLLLRFLRARKFDLAAAKTMIIDAEKWRKEFGVPELSKGFDFPEREAVAEIYPQYYHKTDKDGRPIYIEKLGEVTMEKLAKVTTEERLLKFLVSEYERCSNERFPACSIARGQHIETSCTILDIDGVGLGGYWNVSAYIKTASGIGQNRYPETMGKFYIINAPWSFSTVWGLVKGFLDPVTVDKIQILGKKYQKNLLEQIPAENLPAAYGGQCSCGGGCSRADQGPWQDPGIMAQVKEENERKHAAAHAGDAPPAVEPIAAPESDVTTTAVPATNPAPST
ncbi:hypothetical protein DL93DRAFT_91013 [Clavulina sp. PMI_390]|nr:hypothetical protein DL93DRAFT_91013 [Clavulina sp. PMI_390]